MNIEAKALELINKDKVKGGNTITTIVIFVVSLIAIAILVWKQWKAGKEKAKLLHEKAVKEEEAKQAMLEKSLAKNEDIKDEADRKFTKAVSELKELENKQSELDAKRVKTNKIIEKLSSWDEVDELF